MNLEGKTPVEILQEIMAVLSTRKEAAEKLSSVLKDEMPPVIEQSESFNAALLNELSAFGDGTSGTADRENNYQRIWKEAFAGLENISSNEASDLFGKMEAELKTLYDTVLKTEDVLPESLMKTLNDQRNQLGGS